MAGVLGQGHVDEITTGSAAWKTIYQLVAAANHRVHVYEWTCSFDGVSATAAPIRVQVVRQTTAGTMTADTLTKMNEGDNETLQTTGRHTATVEPTTTDVLHEEEIHPQTGYTWQAPYGGKIVVIGGNRIGIRVYAGAAVNCTVTMKFEE